MSRIERVLDKAERDGQVRRTTSEVPPPSQAEGSTAAPPPAEPPPPVVNRAARPSPSREAPAAPAPATWPRQAPAAVPQAVPASPGGQRPLPIVVPNPVIAGGRRANSVVLHRLLAASLEAGSPTAEQFRALRTRIGQIEFGGRDCRSLVVTSPTPGDGKTITSANLALSMAQEFHRRVLLVDADLRRGALHRMFGVDGEPGLTDVLAGDLPLAEALVWIPEYRLTLLPSGRATRQPTELLGASEMRQAMDILRTHFDRIIIDTPPALALADVGVVGPLADGVLLVVRAGQTPRPAIERALRQVAPARVLGLVLNDVGETSAGYYYGYVDHEDEGRRAATPGA